MHILFDNFNKVPNFNKYLYLVLDEIISNSEGDTSTKKYLENNLVGKVKWFNVKAGFGFINRYII